MSGSILGGVETPEQPVGSFFTLEGWASSSLSLADLRVMVGDQELSLQHNGFVDSSARQTKWVAVNGNPIPAGTHRIQLIAPPNRVLASTQITVLTFDDEDPEVVFELDHPHSEALIRSDTIPISGWALFEGAAPYRVEVLVEGAKPVQARIRLPRLDVAEAFPDHADADVSGFEAKVFLDLPSSVERRISLRVRLHGELGEWTSPARSCIVHTEAVDRNDERLSTELTKRSQWLLARTEPIRNPRHAFVFAHSLRVGGGALWLQELLLGLIKRHGWTITLATALDGPLRSDCEQLEIPVHLTHPCDPSTVAAYEGQVAELALLARASGAGVGLVNTLGAFTGSAAIKRAGLPLAWTVHESFPISTLSYDEWNASGVNPVVRTRWEQALGEADELLFVSHATKEMFERYSSSRKTRVIRYGSPWVRFHGETGKDSKERARKQLGLPLDATILLNVGIMEPRKNQIGLISALERLRPAHPDLMLAVVGYHPSPYGLASQELVSRAHQNSWVKLVDVHPDPLLWFQAADFFVNNSDVESLPRSILEAICCGLPVLASDIFGAREIISDTETGWLFEPNDINALTIAIKRALETPGTKRQEMTKAAYQRVSDWLDPAVYVAEYSNILTRLAQEKP